MASASATPTARVSGRTVSGTRSAQVTVRPASWRPSAAASTRPCMTADTERTPGEVPRGGHVQHLVQVRPGRGGREDLALEDRPLGSAR